MLTFLLIQIEPTSLPWWVTAILAALVIASGVVNIIQLSKSREVTRWKSVAEAADSELGILRESRERLVADNQDKAKRIGVLEARTDLDSLKTQVLAIETQIAHESSEAQIKIIGIIQSVSKDIMEGFGKHAAEDREFQVRICTVLEKLEQHMALPKAA